MNDSALTIVGGTYFEHCRDPIYYEMYGSGLRAAAALSDIGKTINFISCIGETDIETAISISDTFGFTYSFKSIKNTTTFYYDHPLASPIAYPSSLENHFMYPDVNGQNILYYGLIETTVKVNGCYVVYDPQNQINFKDTGSTADHLALILNKKEALLLSSFPENTDLKDVGKFLLNDQSAEVVVIKNGSHGALVIERSGVYEIPVYKTSSVWPIGSGDIFSAAFAWKWILEKTSARDSAMLAAQFTADYCQSKNLPLTAKPVFLNPLPKPNKVNKVYLAGPFFSISERWLINELRNCLLDFGNEVFSPFHDVGIISLDKTKSSKESMEMIAAKDLEAIREADILLAVICGMDAGTLFEIGYARALNKKVIILSENVPEIDLTMLIGSGCEIAKDISTAIYTSSW